MGSQQVEYYLEKYGQTYQEACLDADIVLEEIAKQIVMGLTGREIQFKMNEVQILIRDHGLEEQPLWLTGYKLVDRNQFIAKLSPSKLDAAYFDEDDYIIELCKKKFKNIQIFEFKEEKEIIIPLGIS